MAFLTPAPLQTDFFDGNGKISQPWQAWFSTSIPQAVNVTNKPTLAPAATDPPTTMALANSIRAALIQLGVAQ